MAKTMTIDLENLSKDQLLELRKSVDAAISDFDKRKKKEALIAAQKVAKEYGFSLDEIMGAKSSGPKSAPKYANPEDPTQTWTGRGRQPTWLKNAMASGKKMDDLAAHSGDPRGRGPGDPIL